MRFDSGGQKCNADQIGFDSFRARRDEDEENPLGLSPRRVERRSLSHSLSLSLGLERFLKFCL